MIQFAITFKVLCGTNNGLTAIFESAAEPYKWQLVGQILGYVKESKRRSHGKPENVPVTLILKERMLAVLEKTKEPRTLVNVAPVAWMGIEEGIEGSGEVQALLAARQDELIPDRPHQVIIISPRLRWWGLSHVYFVGKLPIS
jgi:hypothetical protein